MTTVANQRIKRNPEVRIRKKMIKRKMMEKARLPSHRKLLARRKRRHPSPKISLMERSLGPRNLLKKQMARKGESNSKSVPI